MTKSPSQKAIYKGRRVYVHLSRNPEIYDVYYFDLSTTVSMDIFPNMRNAGRGEYWGEIRVDDPDLHIEE